MKENVAPDGLVFKSRNSKTAEKTARRGPARGEHGRTVCPAGKIGKKRIFPPDRS